MSLSKNIKNITRINTTSNNEKIIPNLSLLQKQFKNKIKLTITEFANNARNELNKNMKIKEHISRIKYINDLFKKLLIDIMQKKGTKVEIKNLLFKFNEIFKEDNKILKGEIKEENKKINKYQISLNKEINPLKEQLNQLSDLKFILENNLLFKEYNIIRNQTLLIMVDNKICDNNEIDMLAYKELDDILIEVSKIYQADLYKSLKDLNKIKTKNLEKIQKITQLKQKLNNKGDKTRINDEIYDNNNIQNNILKENSIENTISSFKEFELMSSINTLENIEKKIEDDGMTIKNDIYNIPQKNLIKSSINEILINNKTNNLIRNHKSISSFNKNIILNPKNELELPKLNLKQIKFNVDNKNNLFSSNVDRRKMSSQDSTKNKNYKKIIKEICKIKKEIRQIKKNILKNKEIIYNFKNFYEAITDKYEKYIYGPEINSYILSERNNFGD